MRHLPRLLPALLLLLPGAAHAHPGLGIEGGLASGFFHPLLGLDHVVAMVAVGLWAGQLGGPAILVLPLAFPLVMAAGAAFGMAGAGLGSPELGIALSAVVLGALILLRARAPLPLAALVVGAFALFHGYAHGIELPSAAHPAAYGIGFMAATMLLHATGIGAGLVARWGAGALAVRATGAAVAACGCVFLLS